MKIYVDRADLVEVQNGLDSGLSDNVNTIPGGVLTKLKYV